MRLPLNFFEVLRNKIVVSHVVRQQLNLQRKGGEFSGLCPFHTEKTPSFTVNDQKRFYHCFGCGAHGDVIKFVSETQGVSYNDAAIKLAGEFGIDLPTISPAEQKKYEEEEEITAILELAASAYHEWLLEKLDTNSAVKQYLKRRGITNQIVQEFKLGYAPSTPSLVQHLESKKISSAMMCKAGLLGRKDGGGYYELMRNRLIFPIFNLYNKAIGFGGRALGSGQQPKYLNSPETMVFKKGESFYSENKAFSHGYKAGFIIVVEGYMDLIKLYNSGFCNVVASLGTAFTGDHLQKLWRSIDEVTLCFDGDKAGKNATLKALQTSLPIIKSPQRVSVVSLPDSMDPDDLLASRGNQAMERLLHQRVPLSEAIWNIESSSMSIQYPEDRVELEKKLAGYLHDVKDQTLQRNLRSYYKNKLWQLGRAKNKSGIQHDSSLNLSASKLSKRDTVIVSLFSLFLQYPQLRIEENLEFISATLPESPEIDSLKAMLITQLHEDNLGDVTDLVKDAGFLELYKVLSLAKPSGLGGDIEEIAEFYNVTWQVLSYQYQLSLLEDEYQQIVDKEGDDVIEKALLYQQEIISLRQQIDKLRNK